MNMGYLFLNIWHIFTVVDSCFIVSSEASFFLSDFG